MNPINKESWRYLTWSNVSETPGPLIVLCNILALIMILFIATENNKVHDKPIITVPDAIPRNKRVPLFLQTREGADLQILSDDSLSSCTKLWRMYVVAFRNDHVVWSLFNRHRGSNLSNRYRLFAFTIYLFNVTLGSAIFYAQKQNHIMSEITWSFIVALCSSLPVWLFKWAARATRPRFDVKKQSDSFIEKERIRSNSIKSNAMPVHPTLPFVWMKAGCMVPMSDAHTVNTRDYIDSPSMGTYIDSFDSFDEPVREEDFSESGAVSPLLSSSIELQQLSSGIPNSLSTHSQSPDIIKKKFGKRDTFYATLPDCIGSEEYKKKVSNHFNLRKMILKKTYKLPFSANYVLIFIGVVWIVSYFILTLVYALQFSRSFQAEENEFCPDSIQSKKNRRMTNEQMHWLINEEKMDFSMPSSWNMTSRWLFSTLLSVLESIFILSPMILFLKTIFRLFFWVRVVELITHCLPLCCCLKYSKIHKEARHLVTAIKEGRLEINEFREQGHGRFDVVATFFRSNPSISRKESDESNTLPSRRLEDPHDSELRLMLTHAGSSSTHVLNCETAV